MSQLIRSIQSLLERLATVRLDLVTLEGSPKVSASVIELVNISIRDISVQLRKLVQDLLVQQQEQGLVLAIKLGEV